MKSMVSKVDQADQEVEVVEKKCSSRRQSRSGRKDFEISKRVLTQVTTFQTAHDHAKT